jgi:hypothetical protein
MRDPQLPSKQMFWIFLIAIFVIALLNSVKLGTTLWQVWLPDGAGAQPGVQQVSAAGISLTSFGR